jgi:phosphoenolpyruvate carboxylase
MALFKTDMTIAIEYAKLCNDNTTRDRIFKEINVEYERTRKQILKIAQIDHLLDDTPVLQQSLSRRDSYLDPLNHIQLGLLRRYRHSDHQEAEDEIWLRPLLRSINAISAGLRNTG